MKKNESLWCVWHRYVKILAIMKLYFIISIVFSLSITANTYSQNTKMTISKNNMKIKHILDEIEEKTDFRFILHDEHIDLNREMDVNFKNATVTKILDKIFKDRNVSYNISDKNLIVINKNIVKKVSVTGVVRDDSGNTLPGVSVMEKGTDNGVVTDSNGRYTISVTNKSEVLVFSFIGMSTKEVAIVSRKVIDVVMNENLSELDEVVVVGYGTQRKADLTGAVSVVTSESIERRNVTNVSNALQGAVAGVRVSRSSGEPGATSSIIIRGVTTLEGSNSPLILVDDVPVESINDINPDDIESYTVLQDGASAAIYGSRAAAGVILITTKRAKEGKYNFEYSTNYTIVKPTEELEFVGITDFFNMWNEKRWNETGNGDDKYPEFTKEFIDSYMENHAKDPDQYPNTNWRNLFLKDYSTIQKHNFSVSGGNKNLRSKLSAGYEKQDALYDRREWTRYTVRTNNDFVINDYLGAKFDASYKMVENETPQVTPMGRLLRGLPNYPALWADGRFASGRGGGNYYGALYTGGEAKSVSQKIYSKFLIYIKPFKGLKLQASAAPSYNNYRSKSFRKAAQYWAADDHDNANPPVGYFYSFNKTNLYERRYHNRSLTTQLLSNYSGKFGDHSINAMFGYEQYYYKYEDLNVEGQEFEMTDFPYLHHAPTDKVFPGSVSTEEEAYRSLFGRVSYNYKNRYLIQGNFRKDGSSKFASEYRWGTFPSVSAGWVVSEESFFKPISKYAEFLKFRASYGELGNDRLGNYLYIPELAQANQLIQLDNGKVVSEKSFAQQYLVMRDIGWETTKSTNYGIDFSTLDRRFSLTFDYYIKQTEDMLLNLSVPKVIGYDNPKTNVGDMETKGWNLTLSWKDKIGEVEYSASFNISDSESIIGDIRGKELYDQGTISKEGYEYRTLWGFKTDGIFQTQEEVDNHPTLSSAIKPGDIKILDISGPDGEPDGKITSDDRTFLGGSLPRLLYGGNINVSYKGISFGMIIQGVGKQNRVLPVGEIAGFPENSLLPTKIYKDSYWSHNNTPEQNASAKYPRLSYPLQGYNGMLSDHWIIDGAYMRIKNLSLGYDIPKNICKKVGIERLNVFVSGNDLFSFDSFPDGIDPEQDVSKYFITKTYSIGAKIKF